jgi:hypothetical protein
MKRQTPRWQAEVLPDVTGEGNVIRRRGERGAGFAALLPGIQLLFGTLNLLGNIIKAGMAHILPFDQVDHILRQIARVVTNTLQGTQ